MKRKDDDSVLNIEGELAESLEKEAKQEIIDALELP